MTLAAEKGYTDLAELLLARGANVETRTKKGCSPFFLACKEGFTGISIMLANSGASIEVRVMVITATCATTLYIDLYALFIYIIISESFIHACILTGCDVSYFRSPDLQ